MYPMNNVNIMNVSILGIHFISSLVLYVFNPSTEWLIGVIVFFLVGIGMILWGWTHFSRNRCNSDSRGIDTSDNVTLRTD